MSALVGTHPSPSPDGRRLVFTDPGSQLIVVDLATGTPTPLGIVGVGARWSPDGQWLAVVGARQFTSGPLIVLRPDGSGQRVVSDETSTYLTGLSWSPDGRYLLARLDRSTGQNGVFAFNEIRIVEVATTRFVALRVGAGWVQPAWSPGPS